MNGSEKVDAFVAAMIREADLSPEERPELTEAMRRGVRDMALQWRKALVELWNETGEPATLQEVGLRAGMDSEEYVIAAAVSDVLGMSGRVGEWPFTKYVPILD